MILIVVSKGNKLHTFRKIEYITFKVNNFVRNFVFWTVFFQYLALETLWSENVIQQPCRE